MALVVGSALAFAPTTSKIFSVKSRNSLVSFQSTATDTASTIDTTGASSASAMPSILDDFEHHTSTRLPYSPTGYSTWEWQTHHSPENQQAQSKDNGASYDNKNAMKTSHSINYIEMGDPSKPALLLVHGFGASSYHWRYNIPTLARKYHVFTIDLLGFGWSDKPIMDYDASVWRDQVVDFTKQVILNGDEESTKSIAIAGNSLGGYTAMYACSDERIKKYVNSCILLNAAGRFRDPESSNDEEKREPNPIIESISAAIQRFVIACSFVYTKQPSRIEQILRQVYPINDSNVDSELVESIRTPSLDSSAAEVFYRVITKNGAGPQAYVDDILKELDCPVLLAWGESDPWIKPAAADKMEKLHAEFHGENIGGENAGSRWIRRVSIDAGHCPHDEAPDAVNDAILGFMDEVLGVQ